MVHFFIPFTTREHIDLLNGSIFLSVHASCTIEKIERYVTMTSKPEAFIATAAGAFSAATGIGTSVLAPPKNTDYGGTIIFELEPQLSQTAIAVPSIDRPERLAAVAGTARLRRAGQHLIVTSYLSPALVEACRTLEINAIDQSGNAYLRARKNLVMISGRPRDTGSRQIRPSVWTRRSMQVILALLVNPDLLKQGRRHLADFANVSTGTAQITMQSMLQRKDLIQRSDGSLVFASYSRLLDEWTTLYPSLLRHSLQLGRFRAAEPNWWIGLEPDSGDWKFGGESAAALVTQYLKPEVITLYSEKGVPKELLTRARLRPDPNGNVELLTTPVKLDMIPGLPDNVVHPVLIYADLVASGDARNLQTAMMIRDAYIRHADQAP